MGKNLYSLGLLRNGKVYANKEAARLGLINSGTNDGVAKLARYLYSELGGQPIIRTLVGFYANADEMEENGGGQSYYTVLDIEGSAAEVEEIKQEIAAINDVIGDGISGSTLTEAINDINDRMGSGFTSAHTVADALAELEQALTDALTITLDVASEPTSGYLKTYELKQGGNLVGKIDIPKDMVVSGGSLVHGTWDGNTFIEDPEGTDTAIKIEFANADTIYINTKDLVDFYTAGNAAIDINNNTNTISLVLDRDGEPFLSISESGLKLAGVQTAIDTKVEEVAARERLNGSDGISIASNNVKAVAAGYSAPAVKNPISVDKYGIKFASTLDCGYFDSEVEVVSTAEEINAINDPSTTDVFINGDGALNALTTKKTFKNIEVNNVDANEQIYLYANEVINVDGMEITGDKGSTNGYVLYSAPQINISNLSIANGSTAYNVFEGDQANQNLDELNASFITVDNPSLAHNVFNVYKPKDDAVINITDSKFNLTVDNSNVLRIANTANATGVTINFENIDWTYENGLTSNDWRWAGLIIYQPYGADAGLSSDLTAMKTWKFNFKNCKYNGVKVTSNNFGEHSQVFYLYNVGNDRSIKDSVAEGMDVTFE